MEMELFSTGNWNIGRPIVVEEIPWFRGKDVATSLEYAQPKKAVLQHVDDEEKKTLRELLQGLTATTVSQLNRQPHEVYINGFGLYCLVLRSHKPRAVLLAGQVAGRQLWRGRSPLLSSQGLLLSRILEVAAVEAVAAGRVETTLP